MLCMVNVNVLLWHMDSIKTNGSWDRSLWDVVVSQNHESILERDEKKCRGIKNDRPENTKLVLSIKKKKMAYNGHIKRHHSLQKLVSEGKMVGKRGWGQRRKSWTGNVSEMAKMSMAQCCVKALDRSEWRRDSTPMKLPSSGWSSSSSHSVYPSFQNVSLKCFMAFDVAKIFKF